MGTPLAQVLSEARSLVTRLHDRDRLADGLVSTTQGLHEKINCMKEYQEDLHELNEVCHQKPRTALIHSLQQENRQIRQLQEENRSLRTTLEEYEAGLELIMGQHRLQMGQLRGLAQTQATLRHAYAKLEPAAETFSEAAQSREFAALFADCLKSGESAAMVDAEEMSRLRTENGTLRELLRIAAPNDPAALAAFKAGPSAAADAADAPKDGESTPRAGNLSPVHEPNGHVPKATQPAAAAVAKPKSLTNGSAKTPPKAPPPRRSSEEKGSAPKIGDNGILSKKLLPDKAAPKATPVS